MAVTVASIITNFNSYIGDSSTDRISAAERLQYVTEGTVWLQEELQNDLQNVTYALDYYDTVHYYKVTTALADLLDGADLRRGESDQTESMAHKSARELAEEVGQNFYESSWAIERRDNDTYLVVNHQSKHNSKLISGFDSLTDGGGTWALDTSSSDATNLTIDVNEFKQGNASFNFDADVSQSGNNRATITNTTLGGGDVTAYEDISAFLMWVYIPDVTNFSSVSLFWGTDASNYNLVTVTTDVNSNALVNGWNRLKFVWNTASVVGTPDFSSLDYVRIDLNYTGSQADDTDFRIDGLILARPERLTFHYLSWLVGRSNAGADLSAFTATTDIPFFSGGYDQYKYAVAHKAAAIAFQNLRLYKDSEDEMMEAQRIMLRAKQIIPSSRVPETKSFKMRGNNLTRHSKNMRRRYI